MIDLVKLHLQAGDGGHGRVAFRREKYVPRGGPAGGNGGDGGEVIIRGSSHHSSLQHLTGQQRFQAQPGQAGGKQKRMGARGKEVVIEVPVGTKLWLLAENEISRERRLRYGLEYLLSQDEAEFEKYYLGAEGQGIPPRVEPALEPILTVAQVKDSLAQGDNTDDSLIVTAKRQARQLKKIIASPSDSLKGVDFKTLAKQQLVEITRDGQAVVVCQGGFGGRGNHSFKGPANTTPLEAEYGTWGESKVVILEQLLLADIGLVGLPNAGKSTLLSVLTQARPKIGDYPFTTLEPHLGLMTLPRDKARDKAGQSQEVMLADIPGLIEGASQGKGLGHAFLRHVEHCRLLLFVLFLPEEQLAASSLNVQQQAERVYTQFTQLHQELNAYSDELAQKSLLVGVNKIDLYSPELQAAITTEFAQHQQDIILFSAASQEGVAELKQAFQAAL